MKTRNRLLSGLLAFTLCFGLLSPAALAAGTEEPKGETVTVDTEVTLKPENDGAESGEPEDSITAAGPETPTGLDETTQPEDGAGNAEPAADNGLTEDEPEAHEAVPVQLSASLIGTESGVLASAKDVGRVRLDTTGKTVVVDSISYSVSDADKAKVTLDEKTGEIKWKDGYTPAADETVRVTVDYSYYSGSDVKYVENFDDNTAKPFTNTNYAINDGQSRTGSYGVTAYNSGGKDGAVKQFDTPFANVLVTAWYYDTYEEQDKAFTDGASTAAMKYGLAPTAQGASNTNSNHLGVFWDGAGSKSCYGYRGPNGGDFIATSIARKTGWHKLQWKVTDSSGMELSIDGQNLATASDVKNVSLLTLATNWTTQSNQDGMNLIYNRHYIDDISIVSVGAEAQSGSATVDVTLKAPAAPKPFAPKLTFGQGGADETLVKGESGRVYLDDIEDYAIAGVTYATDNDNIEVDSTGSLTVKDGYTPGENETVKVTAQVTYYDNAEDVIFSDSFEGDKQFGTPDVYAHSTANPLFGRYAATPQGSTNGYPTKTLDPVSDVTVTAWYYDNYADHSEEDQLKFGFSVSGNGNAMGIFYDKSIAALVGNNTKDHYGMRVSGTNYTNYSWGGSNVERSKGWHKFEWVIDSTKGMTTYIDGEVVSTHQGTVGGSTVPELTPVKDISAVKELTDIRLAEGWNNNATNLGYIADKHFIDGVTVVKNGASTQTLKLETTVKVTNPEPPKPVEDLTLDVAVAEGLRKGEQQRVYVTGANTADKKAIIDKVEYSVSGAGADKVDIDPETGVLTVKQGVAPDEGDTVTVTAKVTYYMPEVGDILWMEDMEHKGDGNLIASDGKTYCLAHSGNSDVTGLAASRTGKLAGTTQSTVKDGTFSTPVNQTGTLVFWYYDTATEEELTGTYDSQAKFGMMVNNYQPFFIGVAVPTVSSEYGGGGYEDYTPYRDVYSYRLNGTWYPSNIKRSTGWHKFEVSVTGEGTKAFIDGQPVCKLGETTPVVNDAVKTIEKVIITTNWGNQGSNGKYVNNKHFIDDIYVLAEGKTLGTAQTKTLTYEDMPVLDTQYTTTPETVKVENSAYPKDAWIQVQPNLDELASVKVDGATLTAAQWHVTTADDVPQNASYFPVGELIVYADAFKDLPAGDHKLALVMSSGSEHVIPVKVTKNEAHTATNYYLSNDGNDSNDGHSEAQAWATFDKLGAVEFGPGDKIYLDATSVWNGVQFQPKGSGAEGAPIVLTKYNDGGDASKRPILNGGGTVAKKDTGKGEHSYLAFNAWRKFYPSGTIELFNVEHWEVRGIEITNYAPTYEQTGTGRNGIAIIHDYLEIQGITEMPGYNSTLEEAFYRAGKLQHVIVNDCYIHDVTGYHPGSGASGAGGKMSGGINAYGPYDDLKLDNNIIMYCDVEGIRNDVLAWRGDTRTQFPCYMEGVSISNNFIVGVPGDGVVISSAMEPKLAHNYLTDAGYSYFVPNAGAVAAGAAPKAMGNRQDPIIINNSTNFAGLWFIGTMDAVAEFNESVNNVWTCNDGEAFDADMFTWGTVFQYNYTYKNNGGMCLFMSGNQMDDGTLVRYNVSVMDGEGVGTPNDGRKATFHYNKEPDAIYNNLFILGDGVRGMFGGDSCTAYFYNNMVIKPDGQIGSFNLNTTSNSNAAAKAMTSKTQLNNNLFYPAAILDNVTGDITKENNITPESLDGIFVDLNGFMEAQPVQALAGRSALTGSAATGAGAAQVMSAEQGRSVKTPTGTGFDYAQFEGIKTVEGSPTIGAGVSVVLTIWPQTDKVHPLTKDFFQNTITGKGIDIGPYNWTADAGHYVKLTLEDNGADAAVAPLYGPVGGTVTLPTPVMTGSTFAGWYESEDLTGTAVTSPYSITASGTTLYAKWERQPGKFNVTFDSQGGSKVAPQNGLDSGAKAARPAADPTRDGCKFLGWYKDAEGTTQWNFDTDTVTADVTIYAKWKTLYTVTFDSQGGSAVAAQGNLDTGDKVARPAADPTKAGYRFLGWYKDAEGTTQWNFETDTVTGNTTLYAKWEVVRYTVTFDKNGGDTEATPNTMTVSLPVTNLFDLPTPPTREGYEFVGWNTEPDGSGTAFTGETEVTGDITVYAQWKAVGKFAVIYDSNGGTAASPAWQEVAPGGTVGTLPTPPTRDGYEFTGWNTEADGTGTAFTGETVVDADITVYAQWKSTRKFVVTYDANGGTEASPAQQEVAPGGTVGTLPTAPARSGYEFTGWNTEADGSGTAFTGETVVDADITVYAQWKAQSSSGGSTGGSTSVIPPVTTSKDTEDGDSSTTTTTAKPDAAVKDGVASTTVSPGLGSEIVKQAEQNKSGNVVIAPQVEGDVTKTEVTIPASTVGQIGSKTDASLTVSTPVADVTIPNEALSGLSESGGNITVTAEQTGNTVELSLTAGGKTVENIPGGVKVVVPVEDPTPGTVAVIVREDGAREVVRKSMAGENGMTIPLDGSAKIEIVDNSKQFIDVPATNWASDAVAFTSSRELFNGTSDTSFSPDLPMSRGMLAVVLHNLENNPSQALTGKFADVDNSAWYAEGVSWAAEKGIVTGYDSGSFGPNDDITREQLVVMLWRYAGSPAAADGELNFSDADAASSWALEAMRWATQNGIINGKGNGVLDPAGKATRAQTAQILKNFMENQ